MQDETSEAAKSTFEQDMYYFITPTFPRLMPITQLPLPCLSRLKTLTTMFGFLTAYFQLTFTTVLGQLCGFILLIELEMGFPGGP